MRPHRTRAFFALYRWLPHAALGAAARALGRARRPRWAVQAAIRAWVRRGRIDLREFEAGPWDSVEAFFLRALRPGARAWEAGFTSPADGLIVGDGAIAGPTILQVKGAPLSLARVLGASAAEAAALEGGRYVTIFLTPDGYHRLHMPCDARVTEVRWIAGRAFPQNSDALRAIPRIYERNERASLRCVRPDGAVFWLVLVGASLIGGIELAGLPRAAWARRSPFAWDRALAKGDPLGHFTFGSTVVIAAPRDMLQGTGLEVGARVRVGTRLG